MITLTPKVWECFSCSWLCASTCPCAGAHASRVCTSTKACCAAEGPEVCYTQEDRRGQSCLPNPFSQSLLLHPYAVMGCLLGWWFPWQPAAFCTPRVMRAVCWRLLRGEGRRETGVQSDIGWRRELRERGKQLSAIIQRASVFLFPILLFNQHRTLIKTATRAKWTPPFAYTCCVKSELTLEREFTLMRLC